MKHTRVWSLPLFVLLCFSITMTLAYGASIISQHPNDGGITMRDAKIAVGVDSRPDFNSQEFSIDPRRDVAMTFLPGEFLHYNVKAQTYEKHMCTLVEVEPYYDLLADRDYTATFSSGPVAMTMNFTTSNILSTGEKTFYDFYGDPSNPRVQTAQDGEGNIYAVWFHEDVSNYITKYDPQGNLIKLKNFSSYTVASAPFLNDEYNTEKGICIDVNNNGDIVIAKTNNCEWGDFCDYGITITRYDKDLNVQSSHYEHFAQWDDSAHHTDDVYEGLYDTGTPACFINDDKSYGYVASIPVLVNSFSLPGFSSLALSKMRYDETSEASIEAQLEMMSWKDRKRKRVWDHEQYQKIREDAISGKIDKKPGPKRLDLGWINVAGDRYIVGDYYDANYNWVKHIGDPTCAFDHPETTCECSFMYFGTPDGSRPLDEIVDPRGPRGPINTPQDCVLAPKDRGCMWSDATYWSQVCSNDNYNVVVWNEWMCPDDDGWDDLKVAVFDKNWDYVVRETNISPDEENWSFDQWLGGCALSDNNLLTITYIDRQKKSDPNNDFHGADVYEQTFQVATLQPYSSIQRVNQTRAYDQYNPNVDIEGNIAFYCWMSNGQECGGLGVYCRAKDVATNTFLTPELRVNDYIENPPLIETKEEDNCVDLSTYMWTTPVGANLEIVNDQILSCVVWPSLDVVESPRCGYSEPAVYGDSRFIKVNCFYSPWDCGKRFPDIPESHWAFDHITQLACHGIVNGYSDGYYKPGNATTNAQLAVMLVRMLYGDDFTYTSSPQYFSDVPPTHWAYKYIQKMKDEQIVGGSNAPNCPSGRYCPGWSVKREAMAYYIVRALWRNTLLQGGIIEPNSTAHFPDVPTNSYFYPYIQILWEAGLTNGYSDGTYKPANVVTRAQAAVFLVNAFPLKLE